MTTQKSSEFLRSFREKSSLVIFRLCCGRAIVEGDKALEDNHEAV